MLACYAQMRDIRVYGSVYAQEENDSIYRPVESATVQLLHLPDSTYAAGSITNKEGVFRLFFYRTTTSTRNLLLKISYLGMNTYYKEVHAALNNSELDMGKVLLTPKFAGSADSRRAEEDVYAGRYACLQYGCF